jgi:hypothetical protein
LYGWPLVLAAHALSYLGFVKKKVAKDAGLFRLRDQNLEDHPTTLAIPSNYFYSPGQSATIEVSWAIFHKIKISHG